MHIDIKISSSLTWRLAKIVEKQKGIEKIGFFLVSEVTGTFEI
jgi:hypothetical protein